MFDDLGHRVGTRVADDFRPPHDASAILTYLSPVFISRSAKAWGKNKFGAFWFPSGMPRLESQLASYRRRRRNHP